MTTYTHVSGPSALAQLPQGTPLYDEVNGQYVHIPNMAAYNQLAPGTPIYTASQTQGASGSSPTPLALSTWNANQQSAYDILDQQLEQWGLGSLSGTLKSLLQSGLSSDAVMVQLENSDAYKQRFSGNQIRQKNGYGVLSPAEYIATENAYRTVLRQYGLPSGFYDTPEHFANWIGQDVSATEVQQRAQNAMNVVNQGDPTARNLLNSWYGITQGHLIATELDPTQALPALEKMNFAAQVGAALQNNGFHADKNQAEGLYGTVTQDQAINGIENAGQTFSKTQALAQRYGTTYTQQDALNQYVLGQGAPALIQQQLSQKEESQFARGSALASSGIGPGQGGF